MAGLNIVFSVEFPQFELEVFKKTASKDISFRFNGLVRSNAMVYRIG